MRSPPPARRGNAAQPHQRGRDPRRGRIRAAAAPSRAGREHLAGHPGRDTRLPRTARLDFATWPATVETGKAGLLLLVPDLIALDLPALVTQAGYPGTRVVPAVSWLLSLLALKLTRTRRVSHVDDLLLADPAAALFAGLSTLPK